MSNDLMQKRESPNLRIAAILIAATPVLMAIVPWDFGADFSAYRAVMRGHSFAVIIVEILLIFIAMRAGYSPFSSWRSASTAARVAISVLGLWCVFGVIQIATGPTQGFIGLFMFSVHLIFAFAMAFFWENASDHSLRKLMAFIAFGAVGYCILWAVSCLFFRPEGEEWVTHIPGVSNVRHLGFLSAIGFFAAMAALPESPSWLKPGKVELTILLCAIVSVSLGLWTGARGSIIAIIGASALILVLAPASRMKILKFALLAILPAMLISALLPVPNENYGVFRLTQTIQGSVSDPTSGRMEMWTQTLAAIAQRPMTGWGLDQFKLVAPSFGMGYRQPHNLFLQILFSVGLVGFALLALVVAELAKATKPKLDTLALAATFGMVLSILILAQYDAALYVNYSLMIFALGLALILRPVSTPATDMSDSPDQTGSDRATK
jgi:O-antigen ligase